MDFTEVIKPELKVIKSGIIPVSYHFVTENHPTGSEATESAMWRAAGLEEPNGRGAPQGQREAAGEAGWEPGAQADNLEAGGFFARYGREREGQTAIPRAAAPAAAPPPPILPTAENAEMIDSDDD